MSFFRRPPNLDETDHFSPAGGALPVGSLATHSPAHSFVPLTVPTILHPAGPFGLTCTIGLLPTFGASCAKAVEENTIATRTQKILMVIFLSPSARCQEELACTH
jgi:hypothetical protein